MGAIQNFINRFSLEIYENIIKPHVPESLWKNNEEYSLIYALSKSDFLDTKDYLLNNPDVAASGIDPIFHFVKYGCNEKRYVKLNNKYSNISYHDIKEEYNHKDTIVTTDNNQEIITLPHVNHVENVANNKQLNNELIFKNTLSHENNKDNIYLNKLQERNKILEEKINIFRKEMIRKSLLIHKLEKK